MSSRVNLMRKGCKDEKKGNETDRTKMSPCSNTVEVSQRSKDLCASLRFITFRDKLLHLGKKKQTQPSDPCWNWSHTCAPQRQKKKKRKKMHNKMIKRAPWAMKLNLSVVVAWSEQHNRAVPLTRGQLLLQGLCWGAALLASKTCGQEELLSLLCHVAFCAQRAAAPKQQNMFYEIKKVHETHNKEKRWKGSGGCKEEGAWMGRGGSEAQL